MISAIAGKARMHAVAAPTSVSRSPADGVGGPARLMTIGEVARRSGFTIKALRFYERRGLLPPSGRTPGRYRLYGEADLHRLEFIRQAKALGLTLQAIRELVVSTRTQPRGTTRSRLLRILAERIAQTGRQIATLTRLQQELERRRRTLARRRGGHRAHCTCLDERGSAGVAPRAHNGGAAGSRWRPATRRRDE